MRVVKIDNKELKELVRERLMGEYVLVTGDSEALMRFENRFYTPGTYKNKYFDLIFTRSKKGILCFFALARKAELKSLIKDIDFITCLGVQVDGEDSISVLKFAATEVVDTFVEDFFHMLESKG